MRRWIAFIAAPALALTLVITSCEQSPTGPENLAPAPTDSLDANPDALLGGLLDGLGGDSDGSDVTTVTDQHGNEYTLVRSHIPVDAPDLRVTRLLGSAGGVLSIAGHQLIVPEGLLNRLTLFTLTAVNDGHIEVEVTALAHTLWGVLDIGARGFDQPVTLELRYSTASNLENPQELVILRMPDHGYSGEYEAVPSTVDENRKVVVGQLDRFSRYCMAY